MTQQEADRLLELLKGETEVKTDFPGLTEDEAVEAMQILYRISEDRARTWLARARSEVPYGCVREGEENAA